MARSPAGELVRSACGELLRARSAWERGDPLRRRSQPGVPEPERSESPWWGDLVPARVTECVRAVEGACALPAAASRLRVAFSDSGEI